MFKRITLVFTIILTGMILSIIFCQNVTIKSEHNTYGFKNKTLNDFNFAAVGDWGCTADTQNTLKNIIKEDPQLILGLGDYSYEKNAKCWLQIIKPIDTKMRIVIGNHDHEIYTNGSANYSSYTSLRQYMTHFNLTKQYYSFDYQNVHFVAMSTEVPFGPGSNQYNFVKKDLGKAALDPNIDWIVVFYHRVAYTSPVHPGSNSNLQVRDTFHPLFGKYGVDLVIQGHIHTYQRSYPIQYNLEDSFKPIIMENGTNNYVDPKGQIFTIVGTGGVSEPHNLVGDPRPYIAIQFNAFGFLEINVIHNGTKLVGEFHENNGTIRDHFSITKPDSKDVRK